MRLFFGPWGCCKDLEAILLPGVLCAPRKRHQSCPRAALLSPGWRNRFKVSAVLGAQGCTEEPEDLAANPAQGQADPRAAGAGGFCVL